MIIRSGLIRNDDGVNFDAFTTHWKGTHAPLVAKLRGLRAYSQNHIVRRLVSGDAQGMHRIDGMSQLYFDDISSMKVGMKSPEQDACIVDLRSFLSDVTLLIQEMGTVHRFGDGTDTPVKLVYLLQGDLDVMVRTCGEISTFLQQHGRSGAWRLNTIIARDFRVDEAISEGEQIVDAVAEFWVTNEGDVGLVNNLVGTQQQIGVISGFVADEFFVMTAPDTARNEVVA